MNKARLRLLRDCDKIAERIQHIQHILTTNSDQSMHRHVDAIREITATMRENCDILKEKTDD